jgi:hypothetical protein
MRYEDFTLLFAASSDSGCSVRVLDSPAGQGMCRFDIPLLGKVWPGGSGVFRHLRVPEEEDKVSVEELGSILFDSLFRDEVAQLLYQSLGHVAAVPGCGLRIKLRLNPRETGLAGIYQLPWEYLRRRDTRTFLALDRRTSIVRYLDVPQAAVAMPFPSVLRVLVVTPSPAGLAPLNLARERRVIEAGLGRTRNKFELTILERATPSALRHALRDKPYHILHFSGHGGFSRDTGSAELFFESEEGGLASLGSASLAALLTATPSLRLVIVNACETATISERDVFSGIATSLVLCGIPAVIANHSPISDNAALAFSESFYDNLASGASLDEAVTEGRIAIRQAQPSTWEWGTPSLFSRLPSNELFISGVQATSFSSALRGAAHESVASAEAELVAERSSRGEALEEGTREKRTRGSSTAEEGPESTRYQNAFSPFLESIKFVLRELEAGHHQARAEADKWSKASLVAAGLGLSLVVLTVVMLVLGRTDAGVISSITSLVPTAISALFFSQSRSANQRMDSNLKQLSAVRDVHFAAEIVATIKSEEECNRLKEMIVRKMLEGIDNSKRSA